MKRASMLSSTGTHADAVIAKINERLDILSQLEGGMKGDRYDQYESMDSRTSALASSRDLYRSGSYGYGDGRGDNMLLTHRGGSGFGGGVGLGGEAGFEGLSQYGVAKMRQNMRESFVGGQGVGSGGWASPGRRSPRRGGSGGGRGAGAGFGSRRSEPTPLGGGGRGSGGHRGHSPGGGRGKLPSLLSNRMYPERGGFHQGSSQSPHDFPGRHFGGGPRAGRQRGRKRPLNKQGKSQRDAQKKRKQTLSEGDEPESKINKTESAGPDAPKEQEEKNGQDGDNKAAEETQATAENKAESKPGDSPEAKKKPQGQEKHQRTRKRRGFLERVMFACSVCKFRSFYKEDMESHLESRFHKDHFKFLSGQLSKPTTDFLQEYLQNKFKKIEQRVGLLENHAASICQVYKEQDLTRDLGMEHFMRKVEAAHCAACDLFIPMQSHLIQKHLKSSDHNYNRKTMMEQSKRASLSVARSILNHKLIGKKLESYLKGENPFVGNQDEQDPDDSMVMETSVMELSGEGADSQAEGAPVKTELSSEAVEGAATAEEEEEKMEEELEMEEEKKPEQHHEEEEEGFELGEEEEDSYVIHDEIGEGLELDGAHAAEEQDNPE